MRGGGSLTQVATRATAASMAEAGSSTTSTYHVPVLCEQTIQLLLADKPGGTFLDCTLGGGGHAIAMLQVRTFEACVQPVLKENGGHLYCADRDPDALASAGARLEDFTASGHATLLHSNFASLPSVLRATAAGGSQHHCSSPQSDACLCFKLLYSVASSVGTHCAALFVTQQPRRAAPPFWTGCCSTLASHRTRRNQPTRGRMLNCMQLHTPTARPCILRSA
eukprot:2060857-Pleurochrysis_carterae.AAC.1